MALGDADTGYGVTVTFQSGLLASIRNIEFTSSRGSVDTTHAGTTNGWMTFIPSDLIDPGEVSGTLIFDPQGAWKTAIGNAAETVTINYPNVGTSGATDATSGFLTEISRAVPYDDVMTAECTIKLSGETTYTAGT